MISLKDTRLMHSKLIHTLAAMVLTGFLGTVAVADDTDIYTTADLPAGSEPLVMFVLEFRQNLSGPGCNDANCATLISEGYLTGQADPGDYSKFDVLRAILQKVLGNVDGVKVGLVLNHDDNRPCAIPGPSGSAQAACSNGGFIAVELGDVSDTTHMNKFHATLASLPNPRSSIDAHDYQPRETYFELYRYLSGQAPVNAHNSGGDHTGPGADPDINPLTADLSAQVDLGGGVYGDYISPFATASECTDAFAINFTSGKPGKDDDSNALIELGVGAGGLGLVASLNADKDFEQIVEYLYDNDIGDGNHGTIPNFAGKTNLTSYFIVENSALSNGSEWAAAGGTGAAFDLDVDPDQIVAYLENIFEQILSVSTSFVSASVPVNVFNRAEVVDNAYLALFKVDPDGKPFWPGNLKKLKFDGLGTDTVTVVDTSGNDAIDSDGRIKASALTFWTSAGDLPPADAANGEVAGKDGRFIERGGAGQRIPGYISGSPGTTNGAGRTIYYDATAASLGAFNADSTTASNLQSDLGASTSSQARVLIGFARGLDVDDEDGDSNRTEARSWIMGDPLHSKPLPINYGTLGGYSTTNPAVFIAMGGNDGMLRLIRNTTTGGAESGQEVWAFMPRELMGNVETLRTNAQGAAHPYGVDGAPVSYIKDVDNDGNIESADGDKVWLYFGLRRGGRAYYGFDVTNPTSPDLMWRIDTNTSGFSELGYTFSQPQTGLVATPSGPVPAVIFGGGYDLNKDDRSGIGTDDSYGNAIYVVNAETGALIWKAIGGTSASTATVFQHANLVDSIPANVKAVDTDGDRILDRIVVGDTGGNVWRADINGSDSSGWKLTQLAALGRHAVGSSTVADDRRFFHDVNIAQTRDAGGDYDAVLLGSGDRADPLDQGGLATNYFYMLKDRNTVAGTGTNVAIDHADPGDVTDNCLQTNPSCGTDLSDGWKLKMAESGEKVLASPLTVGGVVFFTSYLPDGGPAPAACQAAEGGGYLYAVKLQDATGVFNFDPTNDVVDLPEGDADRGKDLLSPGIPPEVLFLPENIIMTPDFETMDVDLKTRARTFWQAGEDADL